MGRTMLTAKIHNATVTEANLHYVGSITIDSEILEQVDILPHERVQVVNNHNGERLETYVIAGPKGSGTICLNGAAARLVQPGDTVIIMAYAQMEDAKARRHQPRIAIMDRQNRIERLMDGEIPFEKIP